MKKIFLSSLLLLSFCSYSQTKITVTNPEPDITSGLKRILYYGIENPVIINTGKYKSLIVSIQNGTIRKTDTPGRYMIKPLHFNNKTTLLLKSAAYKKTIEFTVCHIPDPIVRITGMVNEDGMVYNFRTQSTGIIAYQSPPELEFNYKIDSFRITFIDTAGHKFEHMNTGQWWDEITKGKIKAAASKTEGYINDIYLNMAGKQARLPDHKYRLDFYIM